MKKQVFICLIMIFSSLGVFAQTSTISGTVSDKNEAPLPGVTVIVQGTATGTVTDKEGKLSFSSD